jgi:hypothetical protein
MIIETFGTLAKEENLRTVESGILPNTFVLENKESFPGYYGALPNDAMPDAFFLVMPQKEATVKILRVTSIIKLNSSIEFEGSPSRIIINNDIYNSIRIRGLTAYSQLAEIQSFYRDAGIKFTKKKKIDSLALIQIKKIFPIELIDENIYKDCEHEMFYLRINKQCSWSHFKSVTKKVKNNLQAIGFDAAIVVVYSRNVMDMIRIYAKDLDLDVLKEIQKKYNDYLSKSLYEIKQ